MEDLNKIQEFFSKPLEEISTDSVAMRQQYILTEPVQITYTDSFGTGISKARGVLHQANAGYFIGEEDAYIIILPGGTFYVSEDGEVAMRIWPIRDQSDEFGAALAKTPFAPKYEDWKDSLRKAPVKESTKPDSLKSLLDKYDLDMGWYKKHLIGIDNLSPEEESDLEYVEDRIKSHLSVSEYNSGIYYTPDTKEKTKDAAKTGIEKVKDMIKKITTEADLNDPVAMKMRAAKMKADKLAKLRAANAGDDGNDKFFEKSTARLRKLKALKDKRAQIMSDMEQEAELEGGAAADKYGDMLNKLDKAISMLGEAVNEYDVYMPPQEDVDQFFEKETHLQTHYLNSKPVMGQEGSFNKTEVQPWDEYDYSNWKALVSKALEEVKKGHGEKVSKEVFAKLKGKTISYKGEDYKVADVDDATLKLQDEKGKYKTINFNQFNIDGLIREIMETIKLGKQLNEKLCPKGEAYRKKRMAAGEKSSAYLSGRAVKVCNGDMKG